MKSMKEDIKNGLNYLIPERWWQLLNKTDPSEPSIQPQSNSSTPEFCSIRSYIHTHTIDYQEHLKKFLQTKCERSMIDNMHISPQIKTNKKWKIISPQAWDYIRSLTKQQISIPIIYDDSTPNSYFDEATIQLQFLFTTHHQTDLFVGFFPPNQRLALIVREVGKMLGFSNFDNAQIFHLKEQFPKELAFSSFSILTAKQVQAPIQLIGLHHQFSSNSQFIEKHQILCYFSDLPSNDPISLSTRVNTPMIYSISENTQTSRIKKVLHSSKHPWEIEFLRERVEKALSNPKVEIPVALEEELRKRLQQLAIESLARVVRE